MGLHADPFDLHRRQAVGAGRHAGGVAVAAEVDQDVDALGARQLGQCGVVQGVDFDPVARDGAVAAGDRVFGRGVLRQADRRELRPDRGSRSPRRSASRPDATATCRTTDRRRAGGQDRGVGQRRLRRPRQTAEQSRIACQQFAARRAVAIRQGVAQRAAGQHRGGVELRSRGGPGCTASSCSPTQAVALARLHSTELLAVTRSRMSCRIARASACRCIRISTTAWSLQIWDYPGP